MVPHSLVYSFQLSGFGLSKCYSQLFQHEAGCAAYGDAQKKMIDIQNTIGKKTSGILSIQNELEKNRLEAVEARKVEQVCLFVDILYYNMYVFDHDCRGESNRVLCRSVLKSKKH